MHFTKEKMMKSALMLLIALCSVAIMVVILFGVKQFKLSSQLASVNQVANLSHVLVRQQANLFSMLLTNNVKTERLVENLDHFSQEEFVLDASVYSSNGELLAQSNNSLNLRNQLGLDSDEFSTNTQQIVEPIYANKAVAGFLRVTFDTQYGQTTQFKINQIFHQLYGELLIVLLVGILLASSVHYFLSHYRRARKLITIEPLPRAERNKLSGSRRFHRKRRRR
ncbi:YtjB family periplasmic protein [Cricetibacter osteomyelitidis]|nr:YtjB family periplasmic protein [Cricetibacter osteomyelitidis]